MPAAAAPRCCGPTTSPTSAATDGLRPAPTTPAHHSSAPLPAEEAPTAELSEATADTPTGPTAADDRLHALPGQAAGSPDPPPAARRPGPSLRDQMVNPRTITPPARPGWQLLPTSSSCLTCGRKGPWDHPWMKRTLRKNAGACPTPWTSSASVSTTPTPSPTRACCCLHADRAADIEQAADALIDLGERPGAAHPGRKPLALVHANDSLDPPGAARDRHCPIGDGTIGEDGFAALLAHPGIAGVPVVTETTGDPVQMARDVACLRRLRDAARG